MKIGVLGLGAGGLALAYEAASKGFEVIAADMPEFIHNTKGIIDKGGIACSVEGKECFAKVRGVLNISDVIEEADIIFVVTPAFGTKPLAEACKPYAKAGQKYVICPGSSGGALEFKKVLCGDIFSEDILVAETHTLPYAARAHGPAKAAIHHYVDTLIFAALPSGKTKEIIDMAKMIWGEKVHAGKNVLETALINGNPVIHPAVTLCNVALVQRTKGDFKFYAEGITDGVADLMQAVDEERLALAKKIGINLPTEPQMSCNEGYIAPDKVNYRQGYNQSVAFGGIMAQDRLDNRFLTEDVGYGMVLWSSLGEVIGVPTPTIDAMIQITSILLGKDLKALAPRNAEILEITSENIVKI